jgi:hypothetical protein
VIVALAVPAQAAGGFLVPPSNVTAQAFGATNIVVSWSSAASASFYRVSRSTASGGPYTEIVRTSESYYSDNGLLPATRYYYVVQSGSGKKLSAYSMQATAMTSFTAPTGVSMTATESTMGLGWVPVAGAVRYEILRSGPNEPQQTVGSTTITTYRDTGLVSGSYYGYAVRAVAANGATGQSASLSGYAGPATSIEFHVWPPKAEPGQWVLLSAEVHNADGSSPTGALDLFCNGAWLTQVYVGIGGRAEHMVQMGTQPLTFSAQYQGTTLPLAGASGSHPAAATAFPAYGSLTLQPAQARPVEGRAIAVASGDLTGDGLNDVVVSSDRSIGQIYELGFQVFIQQPDHTLGPPQYRTVSATTGGSVPTVTDITGDGRADLLIGARNGVDVYAQTAQGLAADPVSVPFDSPVTLPRLLDLDRDGVSDLVVDTSAGTLVRYGIGGGSFGDSVTLYPYYGELVVADLAGDTRPDVAVLRSHHVYLLTQVGPRQFTDPVGYPVPPSQSGFIGSFAGGDVTGDGRADLVVSVGGNIPTGRIEVLTHSADGALGTWQIYPSYDNPANMLLADMDGDGRLDVMTTHIGHPGVGLMLQRPDGWLGGQIIYSPYSAADFTPYGVAAADITGDGRLDLLLADQWAGLATRIQ